jgi:hypothetical protein
MMWLIIAGAVIITFAALINKAIKLAMKLAVIAVMLMLVFYFLQQAGIFQPATMGH